MKGAGEGAAEVRVEEQTETGDCESRNDNGSSMTSILISGVTGVALWEADRRVPIGGETTAGVGSREALSPDGEVGTEEIFTLCALVGLDPLWITGAEYSITSAA